LDRRLDPDATARDNIVIASNVAVLLLSRSRFKKLARPCSWRSALVWWTLLATSPSYSGLLPQRRHCLHCGHAARVGFKKLVRMCSWRSAGLVAAARFVVVAQSYSSLLLNVVIASIVAAHIVSGSGLVAAASRIAVAHSPALFSLLLNVVDRWIYRFWPRLYMY
jgi:hypothetical protein